MQDREGFFVANILEFCTHFVRVLRILTVDDGRWCTWLLMTAARWCTWRLMMSGDAPDDWWRQVMDDGRRCTWRLRTVDNEPEGLWPEIMHLTVDDGRRCTWLFVQGIEIFCNIPRIIVNNILLIILINKINQYIFIIHLCFQWQLTTSSVQCYVGQKYKCNRFTLNVRSLWLYRFD